MFEDQTATEGHEKIVKAQALFARLMESAADGEFKKIFAAAIQEHSLDEFYPVVVRAELSAALMLCHIAAAQVQGFQFRDYLQEHCGLRPAQLINMPLLDIADICELPILQIDEILRAFGYKITEGVITDHPDAHRKTGSNDVVDMSNLRKPRHAG